VSAPVDVLAVMDQAIQREKDAGQPYVAQEAARAVVADLLSGNAKQNSSLWVQFAENGNMQFFTRDPDRAVEEAFCYARPLTSYYEKPFPVQDLSRFKDLIGFALYQAINFPETDPRRDFIRQANDLIRIIESPKGISE
jgi:hypothetical protein